MNSTFHGSTAAGRIAAAAVIGCSIVMVLSCGSGLKNLPASVPRRHMIPEMPFSAQGKQECVVACMEMVIEYYSGTKPDRAELKERVRFNVKKGTSRRMMLREFRERGFTVPQGLLYRGTIGDLVRSVSRNNPVIVRTWATAGERKKGWAAHYRVVVGYDLDRNVLMLLDPARKSGTPLEFSFKKMKRLWDMLAHPVPSFNWMAVPVPGQG